MIAAIPNQPINFGEDPILAACSDRHIPLLMGADDTVIIQFLQEHCPNAGTFIASSTFESGWVSGGEWDFRDGACADAGQADATLENGDFDTIVGDLYELQFTIISIAGSGIRVTLGGFERTIVAPGTYSYTFVASTATPLAFTLIDDTSAVCIEQAQVYEGNSGISVQFQDLASGTFFERNVADNPEHFTFEGSHVTFIQSLQDIAAFSHNGITCFRIRIDDECAYLTEDQDHHLCSQQIELVDDCKHTILMRVCNDTDQMGFVAGRFEVRLKASLIRPTWTYPQVEEETWANGFINRPFIQRQTAFELTIQDVSGFLHPFLSAIPMFDHAYIGTTEYIANVEDFEPDYNEDTTFNGGVLMTLVPQAAMLTKARCTPIGMGCNPADDPICPVPQATITPTYNGSGQFVIDVVLYGLQGFAADELIVTLNGYQQAPIDFSTPQSVQLGPYSPGDVIEITITNRDGADCNYTHPAIEVSFCEGPGFGFFTTAYEGDIRIRISSSVGGTSGYGGVRPPIGADQVFVQNAFYNLNSADDSVKTYCFWQGTSTGTPQLFMDEVAWDSPGYDITAINVTYLTGLTVFNAQNNLLTDLDLSTNALLASIDVSGNELVSISLPPPSGSLFLLDLQSNAFVVAPDLAGYTANFMQIYLQDNALAEVDSVIIAVESSGSTGGTLLLQGGTNAAPTGTSAAALALLLGRGWTVTTN